MHSTSSSSFSNHQSTTKGKPAARPAANPIMSAVLGYYNIRGLAQPIRLALEYVKEPYTEKSYEFPASTQQFAETRRTQSGNEWFKEKYTLGLQYPNVPYLFIDGRKLSQSKAIVKYLARKHGLMPNSEDDTIQAEMLEEYLMDMQDERRRLIFSAAKPEQWKALLNETYPYYFKQLDNCLRGKQYAIGDYVTYVDFFLYCFVDEIQYYNSSAFQDYPQLASYIKRFQALPQITAFNNSKRGKELIEITKTNLAKFMGKT